MSTVDDMKVNEPYGLGKTLRSAFPLRRWSSSCVPRYSGIARLIRGSRNGISFVMELVNIIWLILTAFLFYFCNQKLHFYFTGFSQKFIFFSPVLLQSSRISGPFYFVSWYAVLWSNGLSAALIRYMPFDGVRWPRITVCEMVINYSFNHHCGILFFFKLNFLSCFTVSCTINIYTNKKIRHNIGIFLCYSSL